MKILVTDGNQRSTLAVVRSLGRKGFTVSVGEETSSSLAGASRFCSERIVYPSPVSAPQAFAAHLGAVLESGRFDLFIPMTDVACELTLPLRDQISSLTQVALPERSSYEAATNKKALMRLAASLDIPIPKTLFLTTLSDADKAPATFSYPVVIKPVKSRSLTESGWRKGAVSYACSHEDLIRKLAAIDPDAELPMIQEKIVGYGTGIFALTLRGEAIALFAHRRLREKPPSGGVSVLRESIPLDPVATGYAMRILQALQWTGVAMVEFKFDQKDQMPKLMEINGRFWGSLQLAIDSGIDFPYLLAAMLTTGTIEPVRDYAIGVKSRWFLGDLDHLRTVWLRRRSHLNLPEGYPGRLSVLMEFMKTFLPANKSEVWDWNDSGPGLKELTDYLKADVRSLFMRKGSK
jgi:predicted ATP-grasp superfamily ATP-dependent carboligase